jgi:hypothetical protein
MELYISYLYTSRKPMIQLEGTYYTAVSEFGIPMKLLIVQEPPTCEAARVLKDCRVTGEGGKKEREREKEKETIRLIKMCLNETYNEVCTCKYLSDAFPILIQCIIEKLLMGNPICELGLCTRKVRIRLSACVASYFLPISQNLPWHQMETATGSIFTNI